MDNIRDTLNQIKIQPGMEDGKAEFNMYFGADMSRVLVIDDDKFVRTSIRAVLEGAGYEVSDASDAETGLGLQRANPFDVVIVDLIMPNKEGLETIRELKRDFANLPIIAISGGGDIVRKNFFHAAELFGAQITLEKPFDGGDLLAAIDTALNKTVSVSKAL